MTRTGNSHLPLSLRFAFKHAKGTVFTGRPPPSTDAGAHESLQTGVTLYSFIYLFICCWFFLLGLDIKPPLANVFFPPAGFNRGSHSNLPPFCSCKQDTQKNQGSVQLCFAIHKHVHRWRHSEKHFFLLNFYNVKVVFKSNYFTLTRGKKKVKLEKSCIIIVLTYRYSKKSKTWLLWLMTMLMFEGFWNTLDWPRPLNPQRKTLFL